MDTIQELKYKILGTLIGLVRSCQNNEPLATTPGVIVNGLLATRAASVLKEAELENVAQRVNDEKYTIVPNCKYCASPCGNTSDYDVTIFMQSVEEKDELRNAILSRLWEMSELISQKVSLEAGERPQDIIDADIVDFLYKGLAVISFEWELDELEEIVKEADNYIARLKE